MKKNTILYLIQFLVTFAGLQTASSQSLVLPDNYPEYTIPVSNGPEEGYLFLTSRPIKDKSPAYLLILDNYGTPVFYRFMPGPATGFTLQKNGVLSYNDVTGDDLKFYIMDSSFVVTDSVWMDDYIPDNHDFLVLENGHFLMFGKDARITDMTVYGGTKDATVMGGVIRELDGNKNTVFEWNSWDHFEITDSYSDLTKASVELLHTNSLEVDQQGNIFLISRTMDEVTKISRENGDILWRLGGKNNQFTFPDSSHMFSRPHDFRVLGNGHYTVFDNGSERNPPYSRGIEYVIDEENRTAEMVWQFDADRQVYGPSGGSTQRLPSGNTLIGYGGQVSRPSFIEVHPDGSKALQLDFAGDLNTGRVRKYPWRTTLFEPSTHAVSFGEWDGYTTALYMLTVKNNTDQPLTLTGYSTRTGAFGVKTKFPLDIPANGLDTLWLTYFPLHINTGYIEDVLTINSDIHSDTLVQRIAQQVKLYGSKMDSKGPEAVISLADAVDVPPDTNITIRTNEPVRKVNNSDLNYLNVDSLLVFKTDGPEGEDVPFDALISTDKTLITITPDTLLMHNRTYYVALSDEWEDYSDNRGTAVSATFKTKDTEFPSGIHREGWMNTEPLHLFPNPGNGLFILEFPDDTEKKITVYDLWGREVYCSSVIRSDSYLLDLSDQPCSVFIVRIDQISKGNTRTLRLVKY
jgi:hypothetical protein